MLFRSIAEKSVLVFCERSERFKPALSAVEGSAQDLGLLILAGAGLAGDDAGRQNHGEEREADKQIMHCVAPWRRLYCCPPDTLRIALSGGCHHCTSAMLPRTGVGHALTPTGHTFLTCEDRAGRERSCVCGLNVGRATRPSRLRTRWNRTCWLRSRERGPWRRRTER